jgi:hypothetical protein
MMLGPLAKVTVIQVEHYGVFANGAIGKVLVLLPELFDDPCPDARLRIQVGDELMVELMHLNPENGVFRARAVSKK